MKNLWTSIVDLFLSLFGLKKEQPELPEPNVPSSPEVPEEEEEENKKPDVNFELAFVSAIPKKNNRGKDVFLLQERLEAKGFDVGVVDGIFGPMTEKAVQAFQKHIGLTGTGMIGVKTLKGLNIEVKTPEAPKKPKGIPTREQMLEAAIGMIEGTIPTRIGPYKNVRESNGKNRSKAIDSLIKAQGGSLGDPYCQWGLQEWLDELCRYYKVDRKKVAIPEGGSTQTVYGDTPSRFKISKPASLCWMTWRYGTSWQGHVGMVLKVLSSSQVQNFEFNTTVRVNEVVRDGQGASYVKRSTGSKIGTMTLRGYIDVYAAIIEAMQK